MTDDVWDQSINVNLNGTFYCSRAVLPTMIKQKSGNIVNFSSMLGWMGAVEHAHYSAAKAGVMTFTRSLAREVAKYNIRVNAIAPGFIWNPFLDKVESQEQMDEFLKDTPLGRRGEPEDLVGPVIFLASEASRWITGETICVSGGLYMPA
jgi:3-oxoacyl-[acyl-carrier protein] reductase